VEGLRIKVDNIKVRVYGFDAWLFKSAKKLGLKICVIFLKDKKPPQE
jgi:hypothetical protein